MSLEREVLFVVLERSKLYEILNLQTFRYHVLLQAKIYQFVSRSIIITTTIIIMIINFFADPPGNGTAEYRTAIPPGGRKTQKL